MSPHPSEDNAAQQTGRTSVTLLKTPFVGSDSLPVDLLAAFNLAAHAVTNARQVILIAQTFVGSGGGDDVADGYARVIAESAREIWSEYPYHGVLTPIASELAGAAEPGSHFGGSSAHEAALSFADLVLDRVWWVADPLHYSHFRQHQFVRMDDSKIRDRLWSIAAQLSRKKWPDADALLRACQVETRHAAAKRFPGDGALLLGMAPEAEPTIWYHGNRCYSLDRMDMRSVTIEEDDFLQAFLWTKPTLDASELETVCGGRDFARIADTLRGRFSGLFAKAIQKSSRGAGGYTIRVRRVPRAK